MQQNEKRNKSDQLKKKVKKNIAEFLWAVFSFLT